MGVRDLLYRFRPAGAPGAAGPAGLPVDRRETAAAELEPVFAALTAAMDEAEALRRAAQERAQAVRSEAADRAAALIDRARDDTPAVRADAAARARAAADAELAAMAVAAEHRAEQVRRSAARQLPGLIEAVVGHVREALVAAARGDGVRP